MYVYTMVSLYTLILQRASKGLIRYSLENGPYPRYFARCLCEKKGGAYFRYLLKMGLISDISRFL